MTALTLDRDVVSVVEVMALAFMQLSAVFRYLADSKDYRKKLMAVVSRQSLYEIWSELGPRLQGFFEHQADDIRTLFEAEFHDRFPGFRSKYNREHGLPEEAPVNLWEMEFTSELTNDRVGTMGDLFDEILRPVPTAPRIRQEAFGVSPADSSDGLDRPRGSRLPLVVLEMRGYDRPVFLPPGKKRRLDYQMMIDLIGRLTGVAEQGEAAAEFAHWLSASPEGLAVIAAMRSAVAAREDQRVSAARTLRDAVASYLTTFPLQRPELEQALQPAAKRLGVPGLARADDDETRTAARVGKLLGAGHQITQRDITRVVLLARSLAMPVGQEKQWLANLGRAVWLQDQDFPAARQVMGAEVARAFAFLVGAASVFYGSGREDLVSLGGLIRAAGGAAEVPLARPQAEHRLPHDLGDEVPGDSPVTREDLAARVRRVIEAWKIAVAQRSGGAGGETGREGPGHGVVVPVGGTARGDTGAGAGRTASTGAGHQQPSGRQPPAGARPVGGTARGDTSARRPEG